MSDLRAVLRVTIVITAIVSTMRGDPYYGLFCLLALALVTLARRSQRIPLELELAVLGLMVIDMTLGNALGLYRQIPWLDKALHVTCGALIAGVVLRNGDGPLFERPWLAATTAVLVALGVGAAWEIAEFGVDRILVRHTQSSPTLGPVEDTMLDLALDAAGGVLGVLLARLATHRERVPA